MIETQHLRKKIGRRVVLNGVTFSAVPGKITAMLGENGAGKSSTFRVLLGLDSAAGAALVQGRPYAEHYCPPAVVGGLLNAGSAHPRRTAAAHLGMMAQACSVSANRVATVLDECGLGEHKHRRVGEFSLGMKQRLGIAGAILADPPVLILDEPANGLDPAGMVWFRSLLQSKAASGGTVLISSHLLGEVSRVADDVVFLHAGQVRETGTVDAVLEKFAPSRSILRCSDPSRVADQLTRVGLTWAWADEVSLRVVTKDLRFLGRLAFECDSQVYELSAEQRDLEQAFLEGVEAMKRGREDERSQ